MANEETTKKLETIKEKIDQVVEKTKVSEQAMKEGKGKLKLEKPMKSGEDHITELSYDFTSITGLDLVNALDKDNTTMTSHVTNKQALYLFAAAAAKVTEKVDVTDIVSQISAEDACIAVVYAKIFFQLCCRREDCVLRPCDTG